MSFFKKSWTLTIGIIVLVIGVGVAGLGLASDAAIPAQSALKRASGVLKDIKLPGNPADAAAKHGFVVARTSGPDTVYELPSRLFTKTDPRVLIGKPFAVAASDNGKVYAVEVAGQRMLTYESMVAIERAENNLITASGLAIGGFGLLLTMIGGWLARRRG